MASDAIVTADDLVRARAQLRRAGTAQLMDAVFQVEPELFELIQRASYCVAGRLMMSGVPQPATRETADDLVETVLLCLLAMRQSYARLLEQTDDNDRIPF